MTSSVTSRIRLDFHHIKLDFKKSEVVQPLVLAPSYHIPMKTRILGAHIFILFQSIGQVYLNVILSIFLRST